VSDKSDKTFDPTAQKIQKAREEGNLFKSQDVTSISLLLVGITMISAFLPSAFGVMKNLASQQFLAAATTEVTLTSVPAIVRDLGYQIGFVLLPFLGTLVVASVAIQLSQSGLNVTMKPLEPKPDRVSPAKGLKRIFSAEGAFKTLKAVIKIAIVGPIAYQTISGLMPEILMLPALTMAQILGKAGGWMAILAFKLLGALVIISAADAAFEKWKYKKDLMMDKQEIKDESKQSEGDPHVKTRRRQLAMEMKRRPRLDHAILKADVIITNPTHFAVMLRYDPEEATAPFVLAKGIRKRAQRIKALAREFEVPMVEDRPLARALYHAVPEMEEIPADLYPAVAAVLAEIYREKSLSL
jgi:flagellar biosynthetic protein FlhB